MLLMTAGDVLRVALPMVITGVAGVAPFTTDITVFNVKLVSIVAVEYETCVIV